MSLTHTSGPTAGRTLGSIARARSLPPITVEQCCCGWPTCGDYWLVGIGKFVQGSGFTKDEAERIAALLNGAAR